MTVNKNSNNNLIIVFLGIQFSSNTIELLLLHNHSSKKHDRKLFFPLLYTVK